MDAFPIQRFEPPAAQHVSVRRRTVDPLAAYQERRGEGETLTDAEAALLELLKDLSPHGRAWAGEAYLATHLRLSPRHVRRLLRGLNARGYVAITHRRGQTNLYKVLRDRPPEPEPPPLRITPAAGEALGRPRTRMSGVTRPQTQAAAPARAAPPARRPADFSDAGPLFDRARKQFNPFRPRRFNDHKPPEARLAEALRDGTVLYTLVGRRLRTITDVKYSTREVFLSLAVEGDAAAATESVTVPLRELGGWWFGR